MQQQLYTSLLLGLLISMTSATPTASPFKTNRTAERVHSAIELEQAKVDEDNAEVEAARQALSESKTPLEAMLAAAQAEQAFKKTKADEENFSFEDEVNSHTFERVLDIGSERADQKQLAIDKENEILDAIKTAVNKDDNRRIVILEAAVAAQTFDREHEEGKEKAQPTDAAGAGAGAA